MANETTLVGSVHGTLFDTSTAIQTLTLDATKRYRVEHLGVDKAGNADTDTVMVTTNGDDPDGAEGEGHYNLVSTMHIDIGPGVTSLKMDARGNNPALNIYPLEYVPGQA